MHLNSGHNLDGWWIDDGLTHGWLFSGVLLAYLLVYRKNSGKFPTFYFSGKVLQPYSLTTDLGLWGLLLLLFLVTVAGGGILWYDVASDESVWLWCRIDKADTLTITWDEWREFLLLHPSSSIHDIVHYWRHATVCLSVCLSLLHQLFVD